MASISKAPRPVIISGPSGAGKSTLIKKLFDAHPDTFRFSISHTTRQPRLGEQNGREYHFVTRAEFTELQQGGKMLETAEFGSNLYGTSRKAVQEDEFAPSKRRCCVLDIEMEGVKQLRRTPNFSARYLFIAPPSAEALEQRLRARATDSDDKIRWRLEQAKKELDYASQPGVHDKKLVNDDLHKAFAEMEDWVMQGLREDGVV
ncbi:MAG: hypothetical protein M1821_005926 [Bathelium mastoideum]|nr:MAG: hypothetical protein M1821_005926 [Bathelium mastoideum]KAI9688534.1 MAG: hypothetical protein M1822_001483 [Bathelium mastoideum]